MTKKYIIEIEVDDHKVIESSILHEDEPIENHIQEVIELALKGDSLYEKGAIEISRVYNEEEEEEYDQMMEEFHKKHPIKWPTKANSINWEDDGDIPQNKQQ